MARRLTALIVALALVAAIVVAVRYNRHSPRPSAGGAAATAEPGRGGELVASFRGEPTSYLLYTQAQPSAADDLLSMLTQGTLVRVNRATDILEPSLAANW